MFDCKLCSSSEYVYSGYLCPKCLEIKKVIDLYNVDSILEAIKYIYIRDSCPIKNRSELVKSGDSSHTKKK